MDNNIRTTDVLKAKMLNDDFIMEGLKQFAKEHKEWSDYYTAYTHGIARDYRERYGLDIDQGHAFDAAYEIMQDIIEEMLSS